MHREVKARCIGSPDFILEDDIDSPPLGYSSPNSSQVPFPDPGKWNRVRSRVENLEGGTRESLGNLSCPYRATSGLSFVLG